eukprot:6173918-Pleurochrysis_carterae.AAC.1
MHAHTQAAKQPRTHGNARTYIRARTNHAFTDTRTRMQAHAQNDAFRTGRRYVHSDGESAQGR